jgi:hypothetical protein
LAHLADRKPEGSGPHSLWARSIRNPAAVEIAISFRRSHRASVGHLDAGNRGGVGESISLPSRAFHRLRCRRAGGAHLAFTVGWIAQIVIVPASCSGRRRGRILPAGGADQRRGRGLGASRRLRGGGYDITGLARSVARQPRLPRWSQAGRHLRAYSCDISAGTGGAALQRMQSVSPSRLQRPVLLIKPCQKYRRKSSAGLARGRFGAMVVAQAVLPAMAARAASGGLHRGDGGSGIAEFGIPSDSPCAAWPRRWPGNMAQAASMSPVVLDGLVEGPQTDRRFGPATGARFKPDDVAQIYLQVASQPPSAWTQEIDLRPSAERF